jgi:hypothetical protein
MRLLSLVGQRYGRLLVVERAVGHQRAAWLCECDCGATTVVIGVNLLRGVTRSCGCKVQKP